MNQRAFSILLNGAAFLIRAGAGFLIGWMLWSIHPIIAIAGGLLLFGLLPNILLCFESLIIKPPGSPLCQKGKCKTADYEVVRWIANDMVLRCKCGDEYFYFGDRYMILDADGIAHPFMIFKNKKERWVPDTNTEVVDTNAIQAEFIRQRKEQHEARDSEPQLRDGTDQ